MEDILSIIPWYLTNPFSSNGDFESFLVLREVSHSFRRATEPFMEAFLQRARRLYQETCLRRVETPIATKFFIYKYARANGRKTYNFSLLQEALEEIEEEFKKDSRKQSWELCFSFATQVKQILVRTISDLKTFWK